jgi:hypothetical protein
MDHRESGGKQYYVRTVVYIGDLYYARTVPLRYDPVTTFHYYCTTQRVVVPVKRFRLRSYHRAIFTSNLLSIVIRFFQLIKMTYARTTPSRFCLPRPSIGSQHASNLDQRGTPFAFNVAPQPHGADSESPSLPPQYSALLSTPPHFNLTLSGTESDLFAVCLALVVESRGRVKVMARGDSSGLRRDEEWR